MIRQSIRTLIVGGALAGVAIGCAPGTSLTVGNRGAPVRVEHPGPPPHAPAHGYRHKQRQNGHDVELVFDSGLGVYVVVGVPNHFYWDGTYLRLDDGRWYASVEIDGGWKPRDSGSLPPGLRKKSHASKNGRGHGKGKGLGHQSHPAKGGW